MKDKNDNNQGWISVHRRIKEHWLWQDPSYFQAWVAILMQVNHEDAKVLMNGVLIDCKRGESLLSLGSWVKEFNYRKRRRRSSYWTMKKVRTFFNLLRKDDMIVYRGVSKTTRLTVCNYDKYQGRGQPEGKMRASRGQQTIRSNNENNKTATPKIEFNNTLKHDDR